MKKRPKRSSARDPMRDAVAATGALATECLLQGASEGMAMAWDGTNDKLFLLRALGNSKAYLAVALRSDAVKAIRSMVPKVGSAEEAARWERILGTVAAGAPEGRVHVLVDCTEGLELVDVSTAELANGRMNRVTGLREIQDVKARCSTRKGALSLLGEAVERLPRCEEVARVRELVRTDWDRPAVVAAAIPAALGKLDPPLLEAEERRVRLSLLVLDQVLRDREASSAYS